MKRVVSLWLPNFAIEAVLQDRSSLEALPCALTGRHGQMQRLHALSPSASALGLYAGQSVADAKAQVPDLSLQPFSARHVAASAWRVAETLQSFTPNVSPYVIAGDETGNKGARGARGAKNLGGTLFGKASSQNPSQAPSLALLRELGHGLGGGADFALNITGCAHLFGGEEGLLQALCERLASMGHQARLAAADNMGAAYAFCHFGQFDSVTPERSGSVNPAVKPYPKRLFTGRRQKRVDERPHPSPHVFQQHHSRPYVSLPSFETEAALKQQLGTLPIAALRLSEKTIEALARVGLYRIEQLLALPRPNLVRRFGAEVTLRLDQLSGFDEEALASLPHRQRLMETQSFPEPLGEETSLQAAVKKLLLALFGRLEARALGVRALSVVMLRVDGGEQRLDVRCHAPTTDAALILRLLRDRWGSIDPGFGIERMAVIALNPQRLTREQNGLEMGGASPNSLPEIGTAAAPILPLAATLSNRLTRHLAPHLAHGHASPPQAREVVYRLQPKGSHNPWRATTKTALTAPLIQDASLHSEARLTGQRPPLMFNTPESLEFLAPVTQGGAPGGGIKRFRWRRVEHQLAALEGPERIEPEWWQLGAKQERLDCYQAALTSGHRLWIARCVERQVGGDQVPRWQVLGQFC